MACQRAEVEDPANNQNLREAEFTASVENYYSDTKTSLDGINVVWSEGDLLAIFKGDAAPNKYGVSYGGSVNTGIRLVEAYVSEDEFGGVAAMIPPTNIAVYPYIDNRMDCRNLTVPSGSTPHYKIANFNYPTIQNYTEDNIPLGASMMVAVTTSTSDYNLKFKNVGGVLKVSLTGDIKVKTISIKGNDGEKISGKAEIEVANDAMPVISFKSGALDIVTLDCGNGVQLSREATTFHLALPPVVFTKGLFISVTDTDGKNYEFKGSRTTTLNRSEVLPMAVLDMSRFTEVVAPSTNTDINQLISTTETNPKFDVRVGSAITEINLGSGFTKEETTASELVLNYTEAPESITINQYGVDYATAVPGSSKGKIIINLPEGSTVPKITTNVPNMTVEVNGGTVTEVDALTAINDLVVKAGTTVKTLKMRGGNVNVASGASVEAITNASGSTVYVFDEGKTLGNLIPAPNASNTPLNIIRVTNPVMWNLVGDILNVEEGGTVVLSDDLTTSEQCDIYAGNALGIRIAKSFTLDLGGHTFSAGTSNAAIFFNLNNVATEPVEVTIQNGTIEHSTIYSALMLRGNAANEAGKLTANLKNVTLKGQDINGAVLKVFDNAIVNLNEGVNIEGTNSYTCVEVTNSSTLNVYDGANLSLIGTGGKVGSLIGASGSATANIYGGTGTSDKHGIYVYNSGATINVSGGTWSAAKDVLRADKSNTSTPSILNVAGGTFNKFDFMPFLTDDAKVNAVLSANTEYDQILTEATQDVTIDLNGKTLQLNNVTQRVLGNSKLTIVDNTLSAAPSQANLIMNPNTGDGAGKGAGFDMVKHLGTESGASFTMKNVNCDARNSYSFIQANLGSVCIENSTINSLYFVTSTNASVENGELSYGSGASYNISNSTLTSTETPIMMNVPLTMNISNTTINGAWQCAMVRGGSFSIDGQSVLNYTRAEAFAERDSWLDGNNVPMAAIMGGNTQKTQYFFAKGKSFFNFVSPLSDFDVAYTLPCV